MSLSKGGRRKEQTVPGFGEKKVCALPYFWVVLNDGALKWSGDDKDKHFAAVELTLNSFGF